MKVYTSYYYNMLMKFHDYTIIRVSTSVPDWFPAETVDCPNLYPGWELVNGIKKGFITEEEYTAKYKEKLAQIDKEAFIEELKQISEETGKDIVLCCWCGRGKFCHRKLIAEWLSPQLEVEEL